MAKVLLRDLAGRPRAEAETDAAEQRIAAYSWLNVAASHDLAEAIELREDFAKQLKPEQLAIAQAKSADLLAAN